MLERECGTWRADVGFFVIYGLRDEFITDPLNRLSFDDGQNTRMSHLES